MLLLFGPKPYPRSTPKLRHAPGDVLSATETHRVLSVIYDFTQVIIFLLMLEEGTFKIFHWFCVINYIN